MVVTLFTAISLDITVYTVSDQRDEKEATEGHNVPFSSKEKKMEVWRERGGPGGAVRTRFRSTKWCGKCKMLRDRTRRDASR